MDQTLADAGTREILETDVVIVGAGPAGLAAAIRLKQLAPDTAVIVVEKAADIGGHILSGAVMNPVGLDELLPDWREQGAPVGPDVTRDTFHVLTPTRRFRRFPALMIPPQMKVPNAVIISLGDLVRWLGEQAQALGVDIFPMTAAVDVLTGEGGGSRASSPAISASTATASPSRATPPASAAQGQIHADRRGRARLAGQAPHRAALRARRGPPRRRSTGSGIKEDLGDRAGPARGRPGRPLSRLSARRCDLGRRLCLPCRRPQALSRASSPISTTATRRCRPSASSSASSRTRRSPGCSRARRASATARAR